MTALELLRLSPSALAALYATLTATRVPVGTFDGVAWPVPAWPFWKGKVFYGAWDQGTVGRVVNRIGPWRWVHGDVYLKAARDFGRYEVQIDYPQLGLHDYLKPVSDALWLGWLDLRGRRIYFTLEQV